MFCAKASHFGIEAFFIKRGFVPREEKLDLLLVLFRPVPSGKRRGLNETGARLIRSGAQMHENRCFSSTERASDRTSGSSCALSSLRAFQEALKMADAGRMAELPQRFRFDLPDAFAGDLVLLADFF